MTFPERETGEPFVTRSAFVLRADASDAELRRAVLRTLLDRLVHEGCEAVVFDDVLFADPHVRPRVWPWA